MLPETAIRLRQACCLARALSGNPPFMPLCSCAQCIGFLVGLKDEFNQVTRNLAAGFGGLSQLDAVQEVFNLGPHLKSFSTID